jgi:hypothetical protein
MATDEASTSAETNTKSVVRMVTDS